MKNGSSAFSKGVVFASSAMRQDVSFLSSRVSDIVFWMVVKHPFSSCTDHLNDSLSTESIVRLWLHYQAHNLNSEVAIFGSFRDYGMSASSPLVTYL